MTQGSVTEDGMATETYTDQQAEGEAVLLPGLADPDRAADCQGGQWCRCPYSTPCYPRRRTGA